MKVYQVVKTTDNGTKTVAYFQYKHTAEECAKSYNDNILHNLAIKANKMNGAMRGHNKGAFAELIEQMQNLPYKVKEISVSQSYRY
jgi:hypothetical protein